MIRALFGMFFLLYGCAAQPRPRLDFQCIARQAGGQMILDCADPETWKEWIKSKESGVRS